jgi:hypothetical protein
LFSHDMGGLSACAEPVSFLLYYEP